MCCSLCLRCHLGSFSCGCSGQLASPASIVGLWPAGSCHPVLSWSCLNSQAEGIGGQQTEMAGMTARGMAKIAGRVEDSDSECCCSNVRCTQMESNEYLRSAWRPMLLATLAVSAHDSALAKSAEIASARIGASPLIPCERDMAGQLLFPRATWQCR
jgi:hypothetical protein